MKKINLSDEELATMSYDDVAYIILENNKKKMKIQDLFKQVIEVMKLSDKVFEEHLADFFELLSTDKRFIMLPKGFWDLKINHKTKMVIEDEEEVVEVESQEEEIEEEETPINYDEEIIDDDETEDELKDLVIMSEEEENENI